MPLVAANGTNRAPRAARVHAEQLVVIRIDDARAAAHRDETGRDAGVDERTDVVRVEDVQLPRPDEPADLVQSEGIDGDAHESVGHLLDRVGHPGGGDRTVHAGLESSHAAANQILRNERPSSVMNDVNRGLRSDKNGIADGRGPRIPSGHNLCQLPTSGLGPKLT